MAPQTTTPCPYRPPLQVGDHYQLSPLVVSPRAAEGGLGVSLFRRLCEAQPQVRACCARRRAAWAQPQVYAAAPAPACAEGASAPLPATCTHALTHAPRILPAPRQSVVALRRQYRMCSEIMALPNALVYAGRLEAGSPAVASAALSLPRPAALGAHPAWLRPLLQPGVRVAFLDTDQPEGIEAAGGSAAAGGEAAAPGGEVQLREGTMNPGEAAAVAALVGALLDAGVPAAEIGVISPYRAQVRADEVERHNTCTIRQVVLDTMGGGVNFTSPFAHPSWSRAFEPRNAASANERSNPPRRQVNHLSRLLAHTAKRAAAPPAEQQQPHGEAAPSDGSGDHGASGGGGVEVLTVDQSQGRDKAVILLSFVRSNPGRAAGNLLADWQRLNVAVTRARVKLLMVGSAATLGGIPLLAQLVRMAEGGGWLWRLPPEAMRGAGGGGGR